MVPDMNVFKGRHFTIFFHLNGVILKVKKESDLREYYSIFKSQGFAPKYSHRF